jgi:hypothetical protein
LEIDKRLGAKYGGVLKSELPQIKSILRGFSKKKRNIQLFYGIPHDYMETPFFVEIMSISACQFPDERLATGATGAKARPRVVSPESGRPSAHTSRSARLPTLALSWPKLKLIVICIIYILYIYIYIYIR